jgi:hypothetical protein
VGCSQARPTGLNCFIADAIASDELAREKGGIVITEQIKGIIEAQYGRDSFNQEYEELSPLIIIPNLDIKRYVKKIANPSVASSDYEVEFCSMGPLPLNSSVYIARDCDNRLNKLIECKQNFVAITGDFQSGKSSLLNQAEKYLTTIDSSCIPYIDISQIIHPNNERILAQFFVQLSRNLGTTIEDWTNLSYYSVNHNLVLRLDEFGCILKDKALAELFIPPLYSITGNNIKIIVCIPKTINAYYSEFTDSEYLRNPKYKDCWGIIKIEPFNSNDIDRLINLLCNTKIKNETLKYTEKILELSNGEPRKVQILCSKLQKLEIDSLYLIKKIIEDKESYAE